MKRRYTSHMPRNERGSYMAVWDCVLELIAVGGVNLQLPWIDEVSQILDGFAEEAAFTDFQSGVRLGEGGQHLVHMTDVLLRSFG